jgi:hypothetical protein
LFTTDELPELARAEGIFRRQHPSHGRVYILRSEPSPLFGVRSHLMLFDRDNDGVFERTETSSASESTMQPWLTDFTTYRSPK